MKAIIKKTLFPLFACCTIFVSAKKKIVTGTVSDSNQPLPGAVVKIKGSSKIIITDVDGKFSVNDLKPGLAEEDLYDSYYRKYSNPDFGKSYQINNQITVFADVNNILNKPLIYHFGKDEQRQEQGEYYVVRGSIGVKLNF